MSLLLPVSMMLMSDLLSGVKVIIFLIACQYALIQNQQKKPYMSCLGLSFILVILALEDILFASIGFISPFVRDEAGAFFLFREKSYFVLIFFSLLSISRFPKGILKFVLIACIGYFTGSGMFWPLYLMFIYCCAFPRNNAVGMLLSLVILLFYYVIFKFSENPLTQLLPYTDMLRFFINLQAIFSDCVGTLFIKTCTQSQQIINLNIGEFEHWSNLTAQAPFFLVHSYFGIYGSICFFIILVIILRFHIPHSSDSFLRGMIIFSCFVQGFLLNPLIFWMFTRRRTGS